MTYSIYCETCGKELPGIRNPKRLISWTHYELRKPVSCPTHLRISLYDKHFLKFNPLTGQEKE